MLAYRVPACSRPADHRDSMMSNKIFSELSLFLSALGRLEVRQLRPKGLGEWKKNERLTGYMLFGLVWAGEPLPVGLRGSNRNSVDSMEATWMPWRNWVYIVTLTHLWSIDVMCFLSILKINGQIYILLKTEIETFAAFVFEKKLYLLGSGGHE